MVRQILGYKPNLELRDTQYSGTALNWAEYGSENSWKREKGDYAETIGLLRQ